MFNTGAGIQVTGGTVHKLRINQFESNGGPGISDNTESLPSAPILTAASVNNGVVTVAGNMFGVPNSQYTIDLYVSTACDPSGFGEGAQWYGAFPVTTNANGLAALPTVGFGNVVSAGQIVTALATTGDHVTTPDLNGSTSPFSGCQMAVPPGFGFSAPSQGGSGHVYEYVPTPGSWTTARAAALTRTFRGAPGHLATIASAFENGIVGALRANGDLRGWIGLTDEIVNGTFAWVTGEALVYTNWSANEPSNGSPAGTGGEDYVEIFASGAWNDQALDGRGLNQGYVVEYDVNPFALLSSPVTVTFSGLSVSGASVSTYTESQVNIVAAQADWRAVTVYGNPSPFIQFMAAAGSSGAGQITVTAGGANFIFSSVDLYSSTTAIPYTFTGLRGSTPVFSLTATQPQTFGLFATVVNPESAVIDTLLITLTNAAAACCGNPMGLDNIVIRR
jgi:hypothetical protein